MRAGHEAIEPAADDGKPVAPLEAASLAKRIADTLDALGAKLASAAARCRRGDDDGIHDVRVAARRLEAMSRLWRAQLEPARARASRTATGCRTRCGG